MTNKELEKMLAEEKAANAQMRQQMNEFMAAMKSGSAPKAATKVAEAAEDPAAKAKANVLKFQDRMRSKCGTSFYHRLTPLNKERTAWVTFGWTPPEKDGKESPVIAYVFTPNRARSVGMAIDNFRALLALSAPLTAALDKNETADDFDSDSEEVWN